MHTVSRIARLTIVALIAIIVVMRAGAATLAQFDLDSISGGTIVTDISGNSHDATFNRSVTLSTDTPFNNKPIPLYAEGKSAPLSIVDTLAYLANPGTIDLNNGGQSKFTLEGWIKPSSLTNGMTLVDCRDTVHSGYYYLGLEYDGTPTAQFYSGNGWKVATWATPLPLNVWTHLAFVYNADSDAYVRLYVNGVNVATAYAGQAVCGPCTSVSFGGGGLGQVRGLIDDIRISNTNLAPSQLGFYKSFTPPPRGTVFFIR